MPVLEKTVGVAFDLAGCPNRCRHCYLGVRPNRRGERDFLRELASAFWTWERPGEAGPYFEQVDIGSSYREPDFADDYKELYDLERELSRREPRRGELLSIWRLARDEEYAPWAREHGPRTCQISFFGMAEVNDYFFRRRGAFEDNLKATERLLSVGMVPRWQIFLTKPGLLALEPLVDLIHNLRLRERVADLGEKFAFFCHPPGIAGEAWNMEHHSIEDTDLPLVPAELMEATAKHFGRLPDWPTEGAVVKIVLAREVIEPYVPEQTWFFVDAQHDVFTNWGGAIDLEWRLGNFDRDGLDAILKTFEADGTPGLWAKFHVADSELADRFGRPDSSRVYHRSDVKDMWIHRYAQPELV